MDVAFSVQFAERTTYFAMDDPPVSSSKSREPSSELAILRRCLPPKNRPLVLRFSHSVVVLDRKRGFAFSVLSAGGNPRLYLTSRRKQNRANEL